MTAIEANSINAATTGIVGNTGTSFTGTAATQYNVIVGGSTSSTLGNVAPSSTSGIPLVSGGSSSNPSFTTAVVAGGGTGVTSTTAYAPLCGGTTTTNPLQPADTGIGTSGFVLTSTGSTSLPTWQAVVASPPSPAAQINIFDDFLEVQGQIQSVFFWQVQQSPITGENSFSDTQTTDPNHPGIVASGALGPTDIATFDWSQQSYGPPNGSILVGAGQITCGWVFNLVNLSDNINTYQINIGMDSVYFSYSSAVNSGNWVLQGESSSMNTAVAATSGWHNGQVVISADATVVTLILDGVTIGTLSGQTPLIVPSGPEINYSCSFGAPSTGTILLDLFYLNQTLTTPR